ncbi:hypothetical protein Nepgr_003418 [Nepenthes gracilis]|uniref:MFS transporter n=1 Tax=Nepenthes gracilis TaxID=150966 RepID=A0AAD3RZK7_NEPGR|nr:hypothetical protein Nepgr_003418 [Nepenthes gracilis]
MDYSTMLRQCFGVALTIDNIIAQYFYLRFDLKLLAAWIIAATFGLACIFARPGRVLLDILGKWFGMRGRLWGWRIFQTLGGALCILLGRVGSLGASVAVMLICSVFVQASCGLTNGAVPFFSTRPQGVVSGLT